MNPFNKLLNPKDDEYVKYIMNHSCKNSLSFGDMLFEKIYDNLKIVKKTYNVPYRFSEDIFEITCEKRPFEFYRLVSRPFGTEIFKDGTIFDKEYCDEYGGGVFHYGSRRFFIIGRPYSGFLESPSNVFLSVCAVFFDSETIETADLHIDMDGEIQVVNCFKGKAPKKVVDEKNIRQVSGKDSWSLDRISETLTLKIPSEITGENNNRRKTDVKMKNLCYPVIYTVSENRIACLKKPIGKRGKNCA